MFGVAKQRVGILDDSEDSRAVLRYWLEMQGFDVCEYERKRDFVAAIKQDELQLALVDLWLPDGSGMDIPQEMKRHTARNIPVIAVTAHAMPGVVEQASDAGFSGFVRKPIDFDTLLRTIRVHLG